MLFTSGNSPHLSITSKVFEFFNECYEIASDVKIFHMDLSDENAVGFTADNVREDQAYHMEKVLFKNYCASLQGVH